MFVDAYLWTLDDDPPMTFIFSRRDLPFALPDAAPGHVRQGLVSGVWAFGLQWRNAQEIAAAFPALAGKGHSHGGFLCGTPSHHGSSS